MITLLDSAIQLAVRAHTGQTDKDDGNMPHIVHCFEVMFKVKNWIEDPAIYYLPAERALQKYTLEELLIAAILHDTVEDCWENPSALERVDLERVEVMFGKKVRTLVDGLTRRVALVGTEWVWDERRKVAKIKEFYRDFIYRAKQDPGVALIKSADLEHNRGRAWKIKSASWRAKLEFKYGIAMTVLSPDPDYQPTWEQASISVTHDEDGVTYFYIADPNGKKIEISKAELDALPRGIS